MGLVQMNKERNRGFLILREIHGDESNQAVVDVREDDAGRFFASVWVDSEHFVETLASDLGPCVDPVEAAYRGREMAIQWCVDNDVSHLLCCEEESDESISSADVQRIHPENEEA